MALTNVLITGGCGFVGSAIARAVAEKYPQCSITVLDKNPPGSTHVVPSHASFIQADVTSSEQVKDALFRTRPVVLIHTAGIVPVVSERFGRKLETIVRKVNVEGTKIVLAAAQKAGVQAFIFTSSCCATVDDMRLPYAYIDESWPTSRSSLIYGESKVRLYYQ
jgi:sterol-4alpha-carboxylate 3-dehydrogenase (decarboxylating)